MKCQCGHTILYHEHYRAGSDCSLCKCRRYAPQPKVLDYLLVALVVVVFCLIAAWMVLT